VGTYSLVAFSKLYAVKIPVTVGNTLNDQVLLLSDAYDVPVLRVLTDRDTGFCGSLDILVLEVADRLV